MKFICKKCGSADYKIIEKSNGNGIATGLYCAKCGQWQKWLNKQEKVLFAEDINDNLVAEADKDKEIARLKAENAELKARLEKAVELKAKVGDTVYMPWVYDGVSGIAGIIVREIQIVSDGVKYYVTNFTTDNLAFAAHYKFGKFQEDYFGKIVFTTREAAESRLAELKGE